MHNKKSVLGVAVLWHFCWTRGHSEALHSHPSVGNSSGPGIIGCGSWPLPEKFPHVSTGCWQHIYRTYGIEHFYASNKVLLIVLVLGALPRICCFSPCVCLKGQWKEGCGGLGECGWVDLPFKTSKLFKLDKGANGELRPATQVWNYKAGSCNRYRLAPLTLNVFFRTREFIVFLFNSHGAQIHQILIQSFYRFLWWHVTW